MSSRVRWLQGCYSTQTLPGRQGSLHTLTWNGCISDHTHFHTRISSQACTAAACMPSHAKTHTRRHTQDLIPTRTHSLRYIPEAKSILSPHVLISIYVPFLLLWKWRALVRVIMAKHDMHGPGHVKIWQAHLPHIYGSHQGFEQRSSNCGHHHCGQRTILTMHARAVSIGRWCGGNSGLHNNGQPLSRESRGPVMGCGSSGQKFDGECLRIPRVGDIARRYAISGELGRGTFATCYLARYGLCIRHVLNRVIGYRGQPVSIIK